ncbi:MAG: sulfatase-like hydrolase/transferase [Actinomycetota bacterium]|nr:sulfatase-like hydrolase/transferase [Actinomycetota bacterium]
MEGNFQASHGGHFVFRSLPGELNQKNSLGRWMQKAGYNTGLVGKYLNEYGAIDAEEVPPGWNRWMALLDNSTYDYFNYGFNIDGKIKYRGDESYARKHIELAKKGFENPATSFAQLYAYFRQVYQPWDDFGSQVYRNYSGIVTGNYAVNFVRKRSQNQKKPFFLYYAPPEPHAEDTNHLQGIRPGAPGPDPRPPARYRDTFDDVPLPQTPSFNEADVSDKASNVRDLPLLTDEDISNIQANYRGRLGALRSIDNQVGRIVKVLKKKGQFKNTFIIFMSDNGYLQGEHRLAASKFMPFENSVRIPAMIAGPGIDAGREVSRPAMDVDMTSTLLQIAGAKPGRTMDGISLLGAAKGKKGLPVRDIPLEAMQPLFTYSTPLTAFDVPYYGVKTPRYKYVNWSFGEQELYDLKNDPDELENLAAVPSMASLKADLEKEAARLRGCVGTSQCR